MIDLTNPPREYASELVMLNTFQQANPANAKATPGFHYRMPEPAGGKNAFGELQTVSGLVFYGGGDTAPSTIDGVPVIDTGSFANWTVTVRSLTGSYLLKDFPVFRLAPVPDFVNRFLHVFKDWRVDPRQCYLQCHDINQNQGILVFRWIYGGNLFERHGNG